MKCPKCGYLGFETTDRCRNCQYDFSLSPFSTEPELRLRENTVDDPTADFELPPISRQTDKLSSSSLDLDRLFGDPEPAAPEPVAPPERAQPEPSPVEPEPAAPLMTLATASEAAAPPVEPTAPDVEAPADSSGLPFDDVPLMAPPAARPPLAVRRATPEVPRNRPRTTRPVRMDAPLAFDAPPPAPPAPGPKASEIVASLMETPALAVRVGAGLIDLALLGAIDVVVLLLTLRIAGLQTTLDDMRVLPPVPFLACLGLLAFGYVAAFTVGGGQTIGKMVLKLRVIGDDGRPVDAAGGVLRAVGCMLVPITLGLSYVPALFSADHRALHDRLAGTRVVSE